MAEHRSNRRLIESVDPVTGETLYTDEATGQIVSRVPAGQDVVPHASTTEYRETTVIDEPAHLPATGTAVGTAVAYGQTAPAGVHTRETEVYSDDPYAPRRTRNYKIQQGIYLIFGIIGGCWRSGSY
jgi:hypothetical protein